MSTCAKRIKTETAIKIRKTIKSRIKIKSRNEQKDQCDNVDSDLVRNPEGLVVEPAPHSSPTRRARNPLHRCGRHSWLGSGLSLLPHPFDKLDSVDGSARVHIVEAELNCLERFLPLVLSLILDFPIHQGLIESQTRFPVGELLLEPRDDAPDASPSRRFRLVIHPPLPSFPPVQVLFAPGGTSLEIPSTSLIKRRLSMPSNSPGSMIRCFEGAINQPIGEPPAEGPRIARRIVPSRFQNEP